MRNSIYPWLLDLLCISSYCSLCIYFPPSCGLVTGESQRGNFLITAKTYQTDGHEGTAITSTTANNRGEQGENICLK